jgi:hypothetical protein
VLSFRPIGQGALEGGAEAAFNLPMVINSLASA